MLVNNVVRTRAGITTGEMMQAQKGRVLPLFD